MNVKGYLRFTFILFLLPWHLLGQETQHLDSITVIALRSAVYQRTLASKNTSISPNLIKTHMPQTAADMLGLGGDVFIQKSQQAGGSPMIRGFGTNRLLYTVDGVRMNTAIFRAGNLQQVIVLDPFFMEKTEICFGPGSVMYGSDAIGAVMGFVSLRPKYFNEGYGKLSATARYSSANNEFTYHTHVLYGGKKWAAITGVTSSEFGDLRMGSNGPDDYLRTFIVQRQDTLDVKVANSNPLVQTPSGYRQINVMQKIRLSAGKYTELEWATHYSASSNAPRYDRLTRVRSNGIPYSAEWYYGPQQWLMNHFTTTISKRTQLFDKLIIHAAWQQFKESRHDRNFNDPILRNRYEKVNAYSLNADFTRFFNKGYLLYGAEWVSNQVVSKGINKNILLQTQEDGPSRYPQSWWHSVAAYGSYQLSLNKKHNLQLGLRYNLFALRANFSNNLPYYPFPFTEGSFTNGSLTGSAGWVYAITPSIRYRATLSTGFRSPNVDDFGKVFDSEPGSVIVPNTQLKGEYAYHAETGLNLLKGKRFELDVCAYYTLLQGALVRRNSTFNGQDSIVYDGTLSRVMSVQNAAKANVYGLQAALHYGFGSNLKAKATLNYQYGTEETDDGTISPLMHLSPLFGMVQLSYEKQRLGIHLFSNFAGSMTNNKLSLDAKETAYLYALDGNGNPYSPSWYTLNVRAAYTFKNYFQLSAGLDNITDQRYRPYRSGINAAGRNLVLALRLVL